MKIKTLILLLLIGCATGKNEETSTMSSASQLVDSTDIKPLTELAVEEPVPPVLADGKTKTERQYDISSEEYISLPCQKCDASKVLAVSKNIENLSYQMVYDFLCSMDSSCKTNIEFSEFSDEALFAILEHHTQSVVEIMSGENDFDLGHLYDRISSPLLDPDLIKLIDFVEMTQGNWEIKQKIVTALNEAAQNS